MASTDPDGDVDMGDPPSGGAPPSSPTPTHKAAPVPARKVAGVRQKHTTRALTRRNGSKSASPPLVGNSRANDHGTKTSSEDTIAANAPGNDTPLEQRQKEIPSTSDVEDGVDDEELQKPITPQPLPEKGKGKRAASQSPESTGSQSPDIKPLEGVDVDAMNAFLDASLDSFREDVVPTETDVAAETQTASTEVLPDGLSLELNKQHLNGQSFSSWGTKPAQFVNQILQMPFETFRELIVGNVTIKTAHTILSTHVKLTTRSPLLTSVMQNMKDAAAVLSLTTAPLEDMQSWSAHQHWARFLVFLQQVFASGDSSIFANARIKGRDMTVAITWILSKIVVNMLSPKNITRNERAVQTHNALVVERKNRQMQNNTTFRADGSRLDPVALTNRGLERTVKKRGAKHVKIEDVPDDEEGETGEGPLPLLQDIYDSDDEPAPQPQDNPVPAPIQNLTNEQVQQVFIDDMNEAQRRLKQDIRLLQRRTKAARTLTALVTSLERRPRIRKFYNRDLALLKETSMHHVNQFAHHSYKSKAQLLPVYQRIITLCEKNMLACGVMSSATEDVVEPANQDDARKALEEEERQRVERSKDFSMMVDLPTEPDNETAFDLLEASQDNVKLNPQYIREACIEAKISDLTRKYMPKTTKGLFWWQVIATKWATDLHDKPGSKHMRGGIIGDKIGLGKTIEAAAIITKSVATYEDRLNTQVPTPPPLRLDGRERPGDQARPHLYVTNASLVHQTAREIQSFNPFLRVSVFGSEKPTASKPYNMDPHLPPPDSAVWDTSIRSNIREVHVVSYNWLAKHYGLEAYWRVLDPSNLASFLASHGISPQGFDPKKYKEDPMNIPKTWPKEVDSLEGKYSHVFADEAQDSLRNTSSYWRIISWLKPCQTIIMSGYLAPRGADDFYAYLKLLEDPELLAEAQRTLEKDGYVHGITNPYELPENSPHRKFCYLSDNYKQFILSSSSSEVGRLAQAKAAAPFIQDFVIARNMDSALPHGSKNTIGSTLPPKHHYTVARIYNPLARRCYDNQFHRWSGRLVSLYKNSSSGQNTPSLNARAIRAIQLIEFLPFLGLLHNEKKADPRPKDGIYPPNEDETHERYNKDTHSWFYTNSELFKSYERQGHVKEDRFRKLRWLMSTAQKQPGGVDMLGTPDEKNYDTMPLMNLVQEYLHWSPKLQSMLALYMDWAHVRDEKILYWFMTPAIQEIAQLIFEALKYDVFAVYSSTSAADRIDIQDKWNNTYTKKRAMFASALVFGTGFNLQKDSCVGVMVDTPDTDNREKQIWGRQHRGGQVLTCHFFRLQILNAYSESRFRANLVNSLASIAAFLEYRTDPNYEVYSKGAPSHLIKRVEENFLSGFYKVVRSDRALGVHERDFDYIFIFSAEAQEHIKNIRLQMAVDQPDVDHSNYWPEPLDYQSALIGISARHETKMIDRLPGFPPDISDQIYRWTHKFAAFSKKAREREGDPDAMWVTKTPSKSKKPKDDMTRTDDIYTPATGDPDMPTGQTLPTYKLTSMLRGTEPVYERNLQFADIAERDALAQRINEGVYKRSAPVKQEQLSDYEDFDAGKSAFDNISARMTKHKSYIPTQKELDDGGIAGAQKAKLTAIRKTVWNDKDFPGFSKSKQQRKKAASSKPRGAGKIPRTYHSHGFRGYDDDDSSTARSRAGSTASSIAFSSPSQHRRPTIPDFIPRNDSAPAPENSNPDSSTTTAARAQGTAAEGSASNALGSLKITDEPQQDEIQDEIQDEAQDEEQVEQQVDEQEEQQGSDQGAEGSTVTSKQKAAAPPKKKKGVTIKLKTMNVPKPSKGRKK